MPKEKTKNPYILDLHPTLLAEVGTMKDIYIKVTPILDRDFQIDADEEILVQLTKMDEKGISVFIPEQDLEGVAKDAVSLEEFNHTITTFPIERRYYTSIPEEEDPEMVEKIHTGTFEVDLTPVINEAIFLNIPYSFHKDKKSKPSTFTTDKDNSNSPFAKLKDYKNT